MRSIKPEYWADQKLTLLPRDVRLLYVALWNFADEEGRMQGDTRLVKSWCFPLDDDVTAAVIDKWLGMLADAGKLIRYEVDGSDFLYLSKLSTHQKLDPRLESRHPAPPDHDSTPVHTDELVRTSVENEGSPDPEGAKHVASSMLQEASVRSGVDTPPTPRRRITQALIDSTFAEFWTAYPRKHGNGEAKRVIEKLIRAGTDMTAVLDGTKRFAADPNLPEKEFIPHPATWLNQHRWLDDALPERLRGKSVPLPDSSWMMQFPDGAA